MEIIWKGTASVILASQGQRILFDPFVPLAGSSVPVRIEDFDGYDVILVTHGHLDHILSLPQIVQRNPSVMIYCTQTPFAVLQRKGVPAANLTQICHGQTLQLGAFTVRALPGRHAVLPKATPKRLRMILRNPARGNLPMLLRENAVCRENQETVFYEVSCEGLTLCLMGSMNLRDDADYPTGCDALILPYNGWEDNFPPAVRCIDRLRPAQVYLDHYDDTFPPLTSPLDLTPILARYPGAVQALPYHTPVNVQAAQRR